MKTGLTYARVSTEEQAKEGQSIDAQIKLCGEYAKSNDIHIADIYKDEGKSGSNTNRPGLQALLEKVTTDGSIDFVLVLDTDRLARNTLDHLSIKALLKKHGTRLISISQPMIDDSPEGRFIDVVLAGANALQSQITGRKTSKVMEQKAKAGWWPGRAHIGYLNTINPSPTSNLDKRIVTPDPRLGPLVTRLFEFYASGHFSLKSLSNKMADMGFKNSVGKPFNQSLIQNILRNPIYYGVLPWKGEIFKGNHQPLTDKAIRDTCQTVLGDHNQHASRTRKYRYLLRGFLFCQDCESRMWAEFHRKANGNVYNQYFCPKCKKGTYTEIDKLEDQVEKWFGRIEISDKYAQELLDKAKGVLEELRSSRTSEQKIFVNQKSAIEQKMKATEDRLLDGTLNKEQFRRIYDRLEEDLKNIDQALIGTASNYSQGFERIKELVQMARNIKQTYHDADYELKRQYLELFFDKFIVEKGKIISATPSKLLSPLIKGGKIKVRVVSNWLPGVDSNHEP